MPSAEAAGLAPLAVNFVPSKALSSAAAAGAAAASPKAMYIIAFFIIFATPLAKPPLVEQIPKA